MKARLAYSKEIVEVVSEIENCGKPPLYWCEVPCGDGIKRLPICETDLENLTEEEEAAIERSNKKKLAKEK